MDQWLEDFKQTIESASTQLRSISEAESEQPRTEGHWSAKQIIGHLIDSAANNHARFVLAQLKDNLVFPGYEQERWVDLQRYQIESWAQIIDLWRAYNLHLVHLMSCTPKEKLNYKCRQHSLDAIAWETVPKTESVTLEYLMKDYVGHLQHHLGQIFGEPLQSRAAN